jgi:predicted nucleic acid-binding protein
MIVYCDTSFLVSFLHDADANHRMARAMAEKHRAAVHRKDGPIAEPVARRVINRFDRAVNRKMFQRKRPEGDEALNMARSLGETHGWQERHTTFDLWHLAAAWALSAGVFLTFDKPQKRIATMLGMG